MVSVTSGVYEDPDRDCADVSDSVLYFSDVYAEARPGKTAGSMAYYSGERDRCYGVYSVVIFDETA